MESQTKPQLRIVAPRPQAPPSTFVEITVSEAPNRTYRVFSHHALQKYLSNINTLDDLEEKMANIQEILKYQESPNCRTRNKEEPHIYREEMKRVTQLFRVLLWQKANWPNQVLPRNWVGLASFNG